MAMIDPQREETIARLRDLNRVLERALMLAGDALVEAHPGESLDSHGWMQALIRRAGEQLEQQHVFQGRMVLFTDDEISVLLSMLGPDSFGRFDSGREVPLAQEIMHAHEMRKVAAD